MGHVACKLRREQGGRAEAYLVKEIQMLLQDALVLVPGCPAIVCRAMRLVVARSQISSGYPGLKYMLIIFGLHKRLSLGCHRRQGGHGSDTVWILFLNKHEPGGRENLGGAHVECRRRNRVDVVVWNDYG